jgi:hypothetical protein
MNQALSYLDVVIAFVAVLVMATSIVMTLAQLAIAILNKRRQILVTYLARLFKDIGIAGADAQSLAADIVSHQSARDAGRHPQ